MAHDQKHNTSSVKHGGGNVVERTCMARTRSHVLVTGDIMTSSLCFSVKLGIISVLLKKTKKQTFNFDWKVTRLGFVCHIFGHSNMNR